MEIVGKSLSESVWKVVKAMKNTTEISKRKLGIIRNFQNISLRTLHPLDEIIQISHLNYNAYLST